MKKLKVIICAMFVLCGGLVFSACGKSEFKASKITLENNVLTYNGNSQAYMVQYEGVDVAVSYSFSGEKDTFKSINELNVKDVGKYSLYYKLSATGYKDYVSSSPVTMTINKADFIVELKDYQIIKSALGSDWRNEDILKDVFEANIGNIVQGAFGSDEVNFELFIKNEISDENKAFDLETIELGEEYILDCSISNSNYNLVKRETSDVATLNVIDKVQVNSVSGDVKSYHASINEAFASADDGDILLLNADLDVENMVNVDKSITVDGCKQFTLVASSSFAHENYAGKDTSSIFNVENSSVVLTLKDLSINGYKQARAVSAFAGKVVIDNSKIFGGKKTDRWRSGGVYITNNASFEMTSGYIYGNDANDTSYTKYCADLWVGANAQASLICITGGIVENVFVNSNSYSAIGAGKFVLDGGYVENVFVEYDSGYGAQFDYISGNVENLMIALKNDNNDYYGTYTTVEAVENTTYRGGKLVYVEDDNKIEGEVYSDNIDAMLNDGEKYVFENCVFNTEISSNKEVDITFINCTFNTVEETSKTNLTLYCATNVVIANCTFMGNTNSVYAIDINIHSVDCEDVMISNCVFNLPSENNVAIAIKQRLGEGDYLDYDSHPWAETATVGHIVGTVNIVGNIMNENVNIYIGDEPQGDFSTMPNLTTGAFHVVVEGNKESLLINNKFADEKDTLDPDIITLEAEGKYDSATANN